MKLTRRMVATWVAAFMMAGTAVAVAPEAMAADGQRAKAQQVLINKGMPADVAAKITHDPKAKITVKANEVYVDGTSMDQVMATASSIVVSAAKGSDYWWSWALNSLGQLKSVIYLRYSWSWMWELKLHMSSISNYSSLSCGLLSGAGGTVVTACVLIIKAYFAIASRKVNEGISKKLCLRWRMPAPPLTDYSMLRWDLVTCRV